MCICICIFAFVTPGLHIATTHFQTRSSPFLSRPPVSQCRQAALVVKQCIMITLHCQWQPQGTEYMSLFFIILVRVAYSHSTVTVTIRTRHTVQFCVTLFSFILFTIDGCFSRWDGGGNCSPHVGIDEQEQNVCLEDPNGPESERFPAER